MEYFVVMIDYGSRLGGLEAMVHPEDTRRKTIDRLVEYIDDQREIVFVHHIHDGVCEVVTDAMVGEARDIFERRDDFVLPEAAE